MMYTRSKAARSAAPQSTTPTRSKSPVENRKLDQESSDEDDEGIPNTRAASTPRHSGVVSLRLPFHARPPKRPFEDEFAPPRRFTRQTVNGTAPATSLRTAPRAVDGIEASDESSNKNTSLGAENEVSDELVKCVSSILSPWNAPIQQQTPEESPSEQLLQEELLQATDHSNFEHENKAGSEEHLEGLAEARKSHFEGDIPNVQGDASALNDDELIATSEDLSVVPDNTTSLTNKTRLSSAPQKPPSLQQDPYDIPISPTPTIHLDEPSGLLLATVQPRDGLRTACGSQERPSPRPTQVLLPNPENISSQNEETQGRDTMYTIEKDPSVEADPLVEVEEGPTDTQKIVLVVENIADQAEGVDKGRKDDDSLKPSDYQDSSHGRHENIASPTIDGIDGYTTNDSDIDLSVEESFSRDIEIFKNRPIPEGEVLSKVFDDPPEDDLIAVHIESCVFKEAMNLMRFKGWSGLQSSWRLQTLDTAVAETHPGRYIMPLLAKLKRLYLATPRAPHLREQNIFLAEHSDMIAYYFSQIDTIIAHIRRKRLENPERNPSTINQSEEKRNGMAEEIMSLIIPMILQVLASAWRLGGDQEDNTQFTTSTVEFLRRGIGWVTQLYYPALRELSKQGEPRYWNEKNAWRAKQRKRDELGTLLGKLVDQLNNAPDMLQEKECERKEKEKILKKQREIELRREQDKRERQRRIREQNRRAFLSIEGKSVPRTHSPSPPRRTASTSRQLTLFAQQWSREEKEFLFRQLSQSYPNLPDLAGYVRQELNRDLDDIKSMSRDILEAMLKEAYDEVGVKMRAADLKAEIENIFRSSGHSYNG